MSIDYDRLRELLDEATPGPWEQATRGQIGNRELRMVVAVVGGDESGEQIGDSALEADRELVALAPSMARELLRLRDGVERYRDAGKALVRANLRNWDESGCASCTPLANLIDITNRLTDLLEGGEE